MNPADAGQGPLTGDAQVGGSVDTPWCKAKKVIEQRCLACHDGNGTGTVELNTYADLTADSPQYPGSKVFARVKERINAATSPMPPQRNTTAEELAVLNAWIDQGAPAGDNPTCTPVGGGDGGDAGTDDQPDWPAECEKFWKVTAHDPKDPTKPYRFPANKEDHPGIVFDAPWGDEEVQALAFRPITDNGRILHHWILYQQDAQGRRGAFLTGWAPGNDQKDPLPDDVGMFMPTGKASLYLDLHYYNLGANTKEELDASGVEICTVGKSKFRKNTATVTMGFMVPGTPNPFATLPVRDAHGAMTGTTIGPGLVLAPKKSTNYQATRTCTVNASAPVTLLTASPHAHKYAVSMEFTLKKKNGTVIEMHKGPFEFEEQRAYPLKEPLVIESGDQVTTTCVYTNQDTFDVTFGEDTANEMCFNFAVWYPMSAGMTCL